MKLRSLVVCLFAVRLAAPFLMADDAPAAAAPAAAPAVAPAAGGEEKETELEGKMHTMGKAFRKLKKQVADPTQNAASLELVATMQAAVTESAGLTPAKTEDIPDADKAKFIADYKAGLDDMQNLLSKLKDALAAGKNDDAVKIVAEIGDQQKKSHKEFRKPKKD